jgi:hypothetical protein
MLDSKTLTAVTAVAILAGATGAVVATKLTQTRATADFDAALTAIEARLVELEHRDPAKVAGRVESRDLQTEPVSPSSQTASQGTSQEAPVATRDRRSFQFGFRRLTDPSLDPEERLAEARAMLVGSTPTPAKLMALRTLVELGDENAADAVHELVEETGENPRDQRMAASAIDLLGNVPGGAVDTLLYDYLTSEAPELRLAAARSLETRGDSGPMAAIVADIARGLEADDPGDRARAVQELGRTRSASAIEPLAAALEDPGSEIRLRAAQGLGFTGSEGSVPALTKALEDPVAEVRSAASRSLARIRNPDEPFSMTVPALRRGP